EQEGFHTVVVRARDGQGRSTLQSFTVHVQPGNSPPAFLSLPTQQAALLRPWQYHALAVDAENDPLHFTLIQGPTGMSMSSSGLVHWIPSVGQLGNHPVQLKVSDGQGGEAFQQFTLTVVTSLQNTNPTLSGSPRTSVRIGDRYYAQFIGIDAEGDPLTYSLPVSPLGMSIDNQGRIEFVPEAYQFGLHPVTVRVEDGQGGVAETSFTLNVVGQEVNHAPVITSTAPLAATLNRSYRYAPTFFDADGDPVIWSLLTKPLGMAVDPLTGIIHWQPANDQLGMHTVVLQATDPMLASTTQAFTLLVRGNNTPPLILSTAITDAAVQQDYEYRVIAQDAEGEMLNYALLTAPDGMVIDPVTGIIHWLPASGQVGNHTVQVSVNDEQGGQAVQTYTIVVSANRFNRPPSITSLPPLKASIDRLYSYQIEAIDPENDAINFALLNGPAGMSVNSVTGQLSWIPLSAQIGSHLVTVGARDASGIYGQQTYRVSVIENQVPVISSTPVTNATSGTAYYYDVAALDPDGDALTYSLVQFQPGMTIDSFGRLRWQVPQAQGTVPVHIVVTDGRGGEATQTYQITVTGDTQAPQVHATLEPNPAVVGSSVLIRVNATDNDRIDSLVLRVNGIVIPLAADGTARLDAMMTGNFPVQITAIDPAGNQGQFTTNLIVHDEDNPTGLGPDIIIISPSNNASITNLVDLVGSITSDSGLFHWHLLAATLSIS
nr:putative Ig domain-containing protein [Gemmatales bacterium]